MHDFEVVGLLSPGNGRSCTLHSCCGEDVMFGNVLGLVACTDSKHDSAPATSIRLPHRHCLLYAMVLRVSIENCTSVSSKFAMQSGPIP